MEATHRTYFENYRPPKLPFWLRMFRGKLKGFDVPGFEHKGIMKEIPREIHYATVLEEKGFVQFLSQFYVLLIPLLVFFTLLYFSWEDVTLLICLFLLFLTMTIRWATNQKDEKIESKIALGRSGVQLANTGEFLWKNVSDIAIKIYAFNRYLLLRLSDDTLVAHPLKTKYRLLHPKRKTTIWKNVEQAIGIYWICADKDRRKAFFNLYGNSTGRKKSKATGLKPGKKQHLSPPNHKRNRLPVKSAHKSAGRTRR